MERRHDDRGDRDFDRDRGDWRSHGRIQYNQHDHERDQHRQSDRYMEGRRDWRHEDEGGMPRFGRRHPGEELPMHGRYQYGPEEDRGQWRGNSQPDDDRGWSRSHVEGPRREEPYRSPSRRDDYDMYREGNYAGYDTWHGHNYYQSHNDPSAMGSAGRIAWDRQGEDQLGRGGDPRRENGRGGRDDDWRHQRYGDYDRGRGDWRERMETGGSWRGDERRDSERFDDRRSSQERNDHRFDDRRSPQQRDDHRFDSGRWNDGGRESGRDIAATWRRFDEWGDTDWTARRDSGIGFRRAPEGGGRFWESPGSDRDDE